MDVLSDVIRVVRLSGAVFFCANFSSPWAIESSPDLLSSVVTPDAGCSLFHILTDGECIVECAGHPAVRMSSGDVIVFPHGDPHIMRSASGVKAVLINSVLSKGSRNELAVVSFGGGGQTARFICGILTCDQRFNPLVAGLPTILVVRGQDDYAAIEAFDRKGRRPTSVPRGSSTWLATTLKFTINEARAARPGSAAMLGRLTELMFVEILREYMQQLPTDHGGWLAGLNDPHVGKALRLLHSDPTRNWTVDDLAREVAISRSALAQRFTDLVGEAPMRYLSNWRIQLAKHLLREGTPTVQEVATGVGYESEAAFNRAFKRATGSPPATWRKGAAALS